MLWMRIENSKRNIWITAQKLYSILVLNWLNTRIRASNVFRNFWKTGWIQSRDELQRIPDSELEICGQMPEKRGESNVGTRYSESRIPSLRFADKCLKNGVNPMLGQGTANPGFRVSNFLEKYRKTWSTQHLDNTVLIPKFHVWKTMP